MPYPCGDCGRRFGSYNERMQHEKSHLPADIPCLGGRCDKTFKTHGGMLIHMEYGTCVSGATQRGINRSAARIFQWKKFIDPTERTYLLDLETPNTAPFKCPECGNWFHKLSGLFQHVDSEKCDCELGDRPMAQLLDWLRKLYR